MKLCKDYEKSVCQKPCCCSDCEELTTCQTPCEYDPERCESLEEKMTCKDCIHYEVCDYHIDEETEMTVNECAKFKDKSRYIELPCKVGDTIYLIERDKIKDTTVTNMYMRFDLFDEVNNPWLTIDGKDFNVFWEDVGTLVFLTREEAEKALKERDG